MIKKSFIGLVKPRFEYETLTGRLPSLRTIPVPEQTTFLIDTRFENNGAVALNIGDAVKRGQKLSTSGEGAANILSTVGGTVASLSPYTGDFGKSFTAVTVNVDADADEEERIVPKTDLTTLETAVEYLVCSPGAPPLTVFQDPERTIHTIVVLGGDNDLLVATNQYIVRTRLESLKKGIEVLKQITAAEEIVLAVTGETLQGYGHIGAEVKMVSAIYPSASPEIIMRNLLGREVPAGRTCEDLGVCFISAEAVASIGEAFDTGKVPTHKIITIIDKAGQRMMASAVIGTPVRAIFKELGIQTQDKDRIILGGPMTGKAIYSEDFPVMPDTNALMVQDAKDVQYVSDYPCINCGDCVRTCPVNIPVNMLIRFLEAGHYEEAADLYDLYSCVECGLCSFVCVSKIPISQYIRLAKYELDRMQTAEAANE